MDERGYIKIQRSLSLLHLQGTSTALYVEHNRSGKWELTTRLAMQHTNVMTIGDHIFYFMLQLLYMPCIKHFALGFCNRLLKSVLG
jgi:hypothetical protein